MRATMQLQGAWVCDVVVSDPIPYGRTTVVVDGGITLGGTARRGGDWLESTYLRLLPGAAGLGKSCRPKHYSNASIGLLAKEFLAAGGEQLAASSDPALLRVQMTQWTQDRAEVGHALSALLQ